MRHTPARQITLLTGPSSAEISTQHDASGEWDFMGRTYVAWSLANMALRDPAMQPQYLDAIDRIIVGTEALAAGILAVAARR